MRLPHPKFWLVAALALAACCGCSTIESLLDDLVYGDSQYLAVDNAVGDSPNERIQAEGAEARQAVRASHVDRPPEVTFPKP